MCPCCHASIETELHALFDCNRARNIWNLALPTAALPLLLNLSFSDHWEVSLQSLNKEEIELAAIICWSMWNDRNTLNQQKLIPDIHQKCDWITSYFHSVQHPRALTKCTDVRSTLWLFQVEHWCPLWKLSSGYRFGPHYSRFRWPSAASLWESLRVYVWLSPWVFHVYWLNQTLWGWLLSFVVIHFRWVLRAFGYTMFRSQLALWLLASLCMLVGISIGLQIAYQKFQLVLQNCLLIPSFDVGVQSRFGPLFFPLFSCLRPWPFCLLCCLFQTN